MQAVAVIGVFIAVLIAIVCLSVRLWQFNTAL